VPFVPSGDLVGFDFLSVNPVINSSAVVRKELCRWEEETCVEDYELWLRLWREKRRFYNCPEILVRHRVHDASAFNGTERQRLEVERLRRDASRPPAACAET
jgi:hypothetical protein